MYCYQAAAYRRSEGLASVIAFGVPGRHCAARCRSAIPEQLAVRGAGLIADGALAGNAHPGLGQPARLSPARPGQDAAPAGRVHARAARPRGAAAARAPAPVHRVARLGRVARAGADGLRHPVRRAQPDAVGRLRDRRPARDARRHDAARADGHRRGRPDRAAARRARDAPRRPARRRPRADAAAPGTSGSSSARPRRARRGRRSRAGCGWCDERTALPDEIRRVGADDPDPEPAVATRLGVGLDLVTGVGLGVARAGLSTAVRGASLSRQFARGRRCASCRASRGWSTCSRRRASPPGCCSTSRPATRPARSRLLFGDRAHTRAAVKERIDNVVRGLLSLGVRPEEHVGVLMRTRPSALVAVAALNRIGAVAVLLRPDGELARELELGGCARVVADPRARRAGVRRPARAACSCSAAAPPGAALDARLRRPGADRPRRRPTAAVVSPEPRAGRRSRVRPVHRLRRGHARRPRQQRTLVARGVRHRLGGGAVEVRHRLRGHADLPPLGLADERRRRDRGRRPPGARRALRSGHVLGPGAPLRRDGRPPTRGRCCASSSSGRPTPASATIRCGCSSGRACRAGSGGASRSASRPPACSSSTPRPRARRCSSTSPTRSPARPAGGCREAPSCASPPTTPSAGALLEGADGFAIECAPGETGMLLAREQQGAAASAGDGRLHDVFEPGDAWLSTGDLFRRDGDGDFWLVGGRRRAHPGGARRRAARGRSPMRSASSRRSTSRSPTARRARRGGEIAVAAVTQRARPHPPLDAQRPRARAAGARARMLARRSSTSCARSRSRRGTGRSRRRCASAACHARAAAPGSATATATGRSRRPIARCWSPTRRRSRASLSGPADHPLGRSASALSWATRAPSGSRPVPVVGSV